MKKSTLLTLATVAMLTLSVPTLRAQELKIGYVSSDRVLRDAAPAKAAQAKLETEFGKRNKDIDESAARLKAATEKLDKDAPTLAESERNRRQRDLVELERDITRKRREFQEDPHQRKNEELAAGVERANKVIKQIAEQEKYDLIVQDAVHWSARVDITDKVIKALNAQAPAAK